MAKSLNRVTLLGNLGADPEIKHTPKGTKVCSLRLATAENYKDAKGEWQEITDWHYVSLWEYLAERAEKYLKKGSRIYVEGKLKTRSYEKNGETRYFTEVRANSLILLDGKTSYTDISTTNIATDDIAADDMAPESSGLYKPKEHSYPLQDDVAISTVIQTDDNDDDDIPF